MLQEGQDWKAVLAFCELETKFGLLGGLLQVERKLRIKTVFDA